MNEDLEMYCRFSSKNEIGSEGNSGYPDKQGQEKTGKRPKKAEDATVRSSYSYSTQHALCGLVRN